ncbi:HAD-IA family hydrolase [uncultured Bradyrhizobium sp.]|jgi:FMN phosphatase YigB (HAD superfamily)|uniref:HAD-IA family hydrolase n=1 Tax=uncultured Bradyrhizobium sp. TaxID=199684 RepID=UPI002625958B|nr:HAD-IA family hydrolase [uncultured Bradyrhizobium sp.]
MTTTVIFFDLGDTLVTTKPRAWLPKAKALLSSLRQSGLRLGIISNTPDLPRTEILKLLPADFDLSVFEANLVLFSSEIGMEKPQRAIFDEAVKRAKVPANQCLFCTENILDTLMAQLVGMHSIRVQTAPNSDLANLPKTIADFQSLSATKA